jgi:hypothetical protein
MGQNTPGVWGFGPLASSLRRLERITRRTKAALESREVVNQALLGYEVPAPSKTAQCGNPHIQLPLLCLMIAPDKEPV